MPKAAPKSPVDNAETARLWREIGIQVREACILRRQGRQHAAATVLERDLPPLIRAWVLASELPSAEAKNRLNQLLDDEQNRVESHWILARFLAEEHGAEPALPRHLRAFPAIPAALPAGLGAFFAAPSTDSAALFPTRPPRRIPIADVVDMIDAARDLERAPAGRPLSL